MATSPKIFSIHGQGLKLNTRLDIEPHLQRLKAIDGVEEVHFGGNTLGVEACEALAEVLATLTNLKVADFADIFTGRLITEIPAALTALCNALKDSTSLVELDLSDNAFGGRSVDPIVPFLVNNRHFQVLKLNNNGLGPAGGQVIAKALIESAKLSKAEGKRSNLRVVICGRNRIQDDGAPLWSEAYASHGTLVEVKMPQNGIRMDGIAALAKGLAGCPDLQTLDLQDNCAKGSGTRALAQSLPFWPKLRTLNLSECLLGGRAGIAFATSLNRGMNPKLETLLLELNELDHRSISILAKAIHNHLPLLTTLELNVNRADPEDQCIQDIKDALASHGNDDALGELDDMEEYEDEEEEEEEEEEEKDAEEEEEEEEKKEPQVKTADADKESDDLAELLGKVSLNST